ncbi:Dolichyl-diphosphooligosaccharide--protein glycosyltransferase subunit Swp1 [Fimicolochytrium jonesii]|uniref:Dolichyl-diphosphooligosaccharide--protein glycosyltransferase subunit Swp1 n=1 Tax=Fimicolochytrium jonesii TaxID=1396493 RepID=UPI0022FEA95F|nr:Dolichyl-diphosphooligosaccharide--protein glycosyltransferase subunit Swp1 [Fimicolochytrium jonesii]KAI8819115.1 Dolichyl-diphosphooligosaccharide--protein glycosyltransferase subunit Swp1 [Fimicolochytrium jonesii]
MRSHTTLLLLVLLALQTLVVLAARSTISVKKIDVDARGPDGQITASESLTQSQALSGKLGQVKTDGKLTLKVQLLGSDDAPVAVQQVVLGVHSTTTHEEASFVCSSKRKGAYVCEVDLKDTATRTLIHSGRNTLKLYAASRDVTPLAVDLGVVELQVTPAAKDEESAWDIYRALPEIKHQFRPEEKHANPFLSSVFSLAVLAPWVILLGLYISLSANISNLFANSLTFTFGTLFLASLGSVVALYYVYWLRLNLFQLLGYGSVLGLLTATLGRQALVARAGLKTVSRVKKDQ